MRSASYDPKRVLDDESGLLRRAQKGDRQAFAELVQHYWDRLYRWLYHLTRNRHVAEDLAQEAFLKALIGLDSFQMGSNFRAWLFRIAYNSFVSQWRANTKARQAIQEKMPAQDKEPVEEVVAQEAAQLLAKTVARLAPEFRAAFLLRVEEGLSFRQVAAILSTTEGTARWRVFKARQMLMEVLAPQLDRERS